MVGGSSNAVQANSVQSADAEVADGLRFMEVDSQVCDELADLWQIVEPKLPEVLDAFYAHLGSISSLRDMLGGQNARLKTVQSAHWKRLFTSRFDADYFESARIIGVTHNRIGLAPKWYIGGYRFIMARLIQIVLEKNRFSPTAGSRAVNALMTALMVDIELVISVYQGALISDRMEAQEKLEGAINTFEGGVKGVLTSLAEKSDIMKVESHSLLDQSEMMMSVASTVARSADEASMSIQAVAAASEEANQSIVEVSRQVTLAKEVTGKAATEITEADGEMQALSESAAKIDEVVALINGIAAQTNLLALNATIEAARAGEAGKGFAVVASEVKELAGQTAKATKEIEAQVADIQTATERSVASIGQIRETIAQVDEVASEIERAVSEQNAAAQEISQNVQQTSVGAQDVASNMSQVADSAQTTKDGATQIQDAAMNMAESGVALSTHIETFLGNVRT